MQLPGKVGVVVGVGSAGVAVVAQSAQALPPLPEPFWPVSIMGWMSMFLSFAAAVGVLYAFHQFTQRPAMKAVEEMRQWIKDQRIEAAEEVDMKLNNFRQATSNEINGWGARVKHLEDGFARSDGVLDSLRHSVTEIKKDSTHQNNMMERFGREFDKYRDEQRARDDRMLAAVNERRDR